MGIGKRVIQMYPVQRMEIQTSLKTIKIGVHLTIAINIVSLLIVVLINDGFCIALFC
ncbi:hypothetical protein D3C73_670390 [compost metagenome]